MTREFTKAETAAINTAWKALTYLCGCTNWSDPVALKEAVRLERRETGNGTAARAMVCKAWLEGFSNPGRPARDFYWIRPGYLAAFLLGVRHACERMNSEYTANLVQVAADLCPAAIASIDTHTARIVAA